MATVIFVSTVGVALILIGRWIYRNPRSLFVSSIHGSPNSQSLKVGARVIGTVAIFLGSYAITVPIIDLIIRSAAVVTIAGLALAGFGAWFLRPAVEPSLKPEIENKPGPPSRKKLLVVTVVALGSSFTIALLILIRLGQHKLVPLAGTIAAFTIAAAIAAIIWFPKRVT